MPEAPHPRESLAEPVNRAPQPPELDAALTPAGSFFVRNNGTQPEASADAGWTWALAVTGRVRTPLRLTVAALRQRFETVELTSVLECAGNGRSQFDPPTDGIPWGLGAVGCARWTGVRLADVLEAAGAAPEAVYVGFESPDRDVSRPEKPALSRGLPIQKALAPETLLAFAMNGQPLRPAHGAPLRVVAPGFPGSAWQKWLTRVLVLDREHDGAKMTGTDYRMPRHPVLPFDPLDGVDFDVITDMPVKSLITSLAEGFRRRGPLAVGGWAWSGHTPVASVEVSADGGATWRPAALAAAEGRWAWRRFSAEGISMRPGPAEVIARATDASGRTQPLAPVWNPRGYLNNAVHRVRGWIEG
jgi:DMSO/TMAO reductase YedYZ molybdopterin-dependent catalytic subunit